LVLLIAATNVAGMLLARAMHRRREIAVRLALGASRARVVRQLVTETLTLGLLGATAGIVLAAWLIGLPSTLRLPGVASMAFDPRLDPVVLAASIGVALGAGLLTGLTPARRATRLDLASGLRSVAAGPPKTQTRVRTAFVIGQLAMSLMLLITAGLFVRAIQRGLTIDPGLDATGVGVAGINLEPHGYDGARSRAFFDALVDRLAARPEIAAVGLGLFTPFSGSYAGLVVVPEGAGPAAQLMHVSWGIASPGYFESTQVPIVVGRAFAAADARGQPPVVIVNETLARRFWPGESPLGKRIVFRGDPRSVVGVSRDGKVRGLSEEQLAYLYIPYQQRLLRKMFVYARGRVGAAAALGAIRDEVASLDGNIALESAMPLAEQISLPLLPQRIAAWLVGVFGGIGLVLAAFGVYGIIAYHVAARTREFGIRLALGATGGMLIRDVLRYAVLIVGVATLLGVVASMGMARLAAGFLFGISATDPITFVIVPPTLAVVAIAASYIPARRAAKVDPVTSLRAE
jgi:predicted permease